MTAHCFRFLAALLICGVVPHPAARAGDAGSEQPPAHLRDLVREGEGVIWGLVPYLYQNSGPYRFENGRWRAVTVAGLPDKCRPLRLTQRADGAAVCVWENGDARRTFSVHRGAESKVAGTVVLAASQPSYVENQRLFADSKNNVWFTSAASEICRLSPDGRAECLHVIQPDECFARGRPTPGSTGPAHWNTVSAVEDARGRVWFYTTGEVYNNASLNGALVFDGETFTPHEILLDGKPPRVELLSPKDSGHFWAGTWDQGLCILDTATGALERVPDQPPEARSTQATLRRGEDWFFVCGPVGYGRADPLWRLRAGQWEKVIDNVDANPFASHRGDERLWMRVAGGDYLGSAGSGLWFLPDEGPPARLDWRQGFPLASPRRLVPLPDQGGWLALDESGTNWIGRPEVLLAATTPAENPRLRFARTREALVPDRQRHLWGGFPENARTLSEWDGERWIPHDLPPETAPPEGYRTIMGVDGLQRVWMRAEWGSKRRTFIYDPSQGHWQSFDEFEKALEAQTPLGRDAEPPDQQNTYDLARFGPHGQICYYTRQSKVAWFDGHEWHRWSRDEVAGKGSSLYFDGPPFFTADGRLRVNLSQQTYEYSGDHGWQRAADHELGYADNEARAAAHPRPEVPPGALTRTPDSAAVDEEGGYWYTWQGNLFRCRGGLGVAVFRPGEAQPFSDHRRLAGVFVDARGNAFLYTDERREYVILAPPGPPPHTALALAPAGPGAPADIAVVRLGSDAGPVEGKSRFDWRLDGGAWHPVATEAAPVNVTLDGLPGGAHRFEARSFDAALQTDASPAVLPFEIRLDPRAQVAGYVDQLADPDYARRTAAVAALARQPELALPALQAARAGANEDRRWWIDAALQQIESTPRPRARPFSKMSDPGL